MKATHNIEKRAIMKPTPKHVWKARLGVGLTMLLLAFLGMIVTDVRTTGGWDYWKWMVPIYAILALWLSWYVKRQMQTLSPITVWHELLHWAGLMISVSMMSFYVHIGTISRFVAGLFDLTLISLAVFLAGIYIESTFILTGIILGIFAVIMAYFIQYLFAFTIPLVIGAVIIFGVMAWLSRKKTNDQ